MTAATTAALATATARMCGTTAAIGGLVDNPMCDPSLVALLDRSAAYTDRDAMLVAWLVGWHSVNDGLFAGGAS